MDVLHMNISAAVLIIVILILRALTLYKLPKKTFLILWGIVIFRLILPLSIPSRLSVYTWFGQSFIETRNVNIGVTGTSNIIIEPSVTDITDTGKLTNRSATSSILTPSAIIFLWIIGICVCAIFFAVTYLKCRKEFNTALPVDCEFITNWKQNHPIILPVQIKQSDRIKAPLTYGVFRPIILFPRTTDWMDETKLEYILTHEYVHIKRFDALTKLLLTAISCIHWFNPFVWVMYILANRDIELSCDETVVRIVGEPLKSAYALTLIKLEEKKSGLTPLCNNFSKNAIEERIIAIMKIKKHSTFIIMAAVLLVIGITVGFGTSNAKASNNMDLQVNTCVPIPDSTSGNVTETSSQPVTNSADSNPSESNPGGTNVTPSNNSTEIQGNSKSTELISSKSGIITSKRYYPITNEYLLTRYDSNTNVTMVSFDDGSTWMFRSFNADTNAAQYSLDGKIWGPAPTTQNNS